MEQRCQLALWTLSGCWRYFKHLLYKCTLTFMVENILRKISLLVGLEITWKILTLGFYIEINTKTTWLNNLLRCFTIYKYKIEFRFKRRILSMSIVNLKIKVKNCLCLQHLILKKACLKSDQIHLEWGNY